MPDLTWEQVKTNAAIVPNGVGAIAEGVRKGACSIYSRYPSWLTNGVVTDTPALQLIRSTMAEICEGEPPPPPPTTPFTGGQCVGVTYTVQVSWNSGQEGSEEQSTELIVPGKVYGLVTERFGDTELIGFGLKHGTFNQGEEGEPTVSNIASYFEGKGNARITNISRNDGGSISTCGNPPPQWQDNNVSPPPSVTNNNITINNNDGTSFTFPVVYAPITPTLNLNVDLGGVTLKLDVGGITFSPQVNFNTGDVTNNIAQSGDINQQINQIQQTINQISQTVNNVSNQTTTNTQNIVNLGDIINNIDVKIPPPPPPPEDTKQEDREEGEGDKEENPLIEYVCIYLTRRPNKGSIQWGNGAPDWMAAGWFEWLFFDDGFLPREPIHFDRSCFPKPEGANVRGYAYTLTNGARGFARVYQREVQNG